MSVAFAAKVVWDAKRTPQLYCRGFLNEKQLCYAGDAMVSKCGYHSPS